MINRRKDEKISLNDVWRDDVLRRKLTAQNIKRILTSFSQNMVIGIQGEYGSGKSFFVQRLSEEMRKEHYDTLYMNIWEQDISDNPIIGFCSQFVIGMKNEFPDSFSSRNTEDAETRLYRISSGMESYIRQHVIPQIIRNTTKGVMDLNVAKQHLAYGEANSSSEDTEQERAVENLVSQYESDTKYIKDARNAIEESVSNIRKDMSRTNSMLYVFVDEIDRCRPDYVIELLEAIKHVFDCKNVIFIMSFDRKQIDSCVRVKFGDTIDTREYLRRFFDYVVNLPDPEPDRFLTAISNNHYFTDLYNQSGGDINEFLSTVSFFLRLSAPPLRKIEDEIMRSSFIFRLYGEMRWIVRDMLAVTVGLELYSSETCEQFFNNNISDIEVLKSLDGYIASDEDSGEFSFIASLIILLEEGQNIRIDHAERTNGVSHKIKKDRVEEMIGQMTQRCGRLVFRGATPKQYIKDIWNLAPVGQ